MILDWSPKISTTAQPSTNSSNIGNLSTALEGIQDQDFTLITINSGQIEELRSTANSTRQAVENGNMTDALIRLRILDQQLQLLSEKTSPFGE